MANRKKHRLRGGQLRLGTPDWEPLLAFAPEEIPDFMWMYRVDLEDGTVVEGYKHFWTRGYLHLASGGRGFAWVATGLYEEVDPSALLEEVLGGQEPRANIVRHNEWVDGERISWTRSATRDRIRREDTLFAIQHAGICFQRGAGFDGEPRLYFFGADEAERALEIVAFEGATGGLCVVHSMPLRSRFEGDYEEAMRWQK